MLPLRLLLLLGECSEGVLPHCCWVRHEWISRSCASLHATRHHRVERILACHHLLLDHLCLILHRHLHLLLHHGILLVTHRVRHELRLLGNINWLGLLLLRCRSTKGIEIKLRLNRLLLLVGLFLFFYHIVKLKDVQLGGRTWLILSDTTCQ